MLPEGFSIRQFCIVSFQHNISRRDVQKSSLRASCQTGPYKNNTVTQIYNIYVIIGTYIHLQQFIIFLIE